MFSRIIITSLLFLSTGMVSHAQENDNKFILSIGPEISWAEGTLQNTASFGYGGHVHAELVTIEKLRITAGFSGINYTGRKYKDIYGYENKYLDFEALRLTGGIKYFCYRGLFVEGKAGVFTDLGADVHTTGFTYSPVIGFEFGEDTYYDINLHYDTYVYHGQSLGGISFTISYQF